MATTATAGLGLLFLLVLIAHSVTGDSVSPTLISTISLLQNNATTAHNTTTNATTTSKPPTTQQSHTTTQSSTTARTTALPEPGVGSYNVSQQSLVCLRADLALRLYVNYQDNAGNIKVGQFNVDPKDTVASGKCGDTEALLNLTFSHGFVLAMFTKDKNEVSVTEVNATLKYQFPDAKVAEYSASSGPLSYTLAPANTSYRCIANLQLPVTANFSLDLSHVQLQPFNLENGTFSPVTDCTQDKTTPIPTTTHSPSTSSPPFLPGKYNVSEKGHACLLVDVALEVQVEDSQNKTHIFVVHPSRTSASGHCQSITSLLNLTFAEGFIAFSFATSNKRFHLEQISIDLKLHIPDAPNDTFVGSKGNLTLFPANLGSSYMCKAKQNESIGDQILLMVSDLRLQPFQVKNDAFSTAEDCQVDDKFLVPIIVGAVLAVFVVGVVIAYFIGRRRSRDAEYQQF
ncbi:unnamed protein product [Lampetra fluviatilis]